MRVDWYALADQTAHAVIDALPADLKRKVSEIAITLDARPFPGEEQQDGDGEALLGLFEWPTCIEAGGLIEGGWFAPVIRLYVANLRAEAKDNPARFRREVRMTLLHELGHYLGLEEDDLERRGLA